MHKLISSFNSVIVDLVYSINTYNFCTGAHASQMFTGSKAEHHERPLSGLTHVRFRIDHQAARYGILTTEEVKYGMMTLTNNMLRDQRIAVAPALVSQDAAANLRRLKEQVTVHSFQFKAALNCFSKQRVALCGKVGGMKNEVCMAIQLAIYFSKIVSLFYYS